MPDSVRLRVQEQAPAHIVGRWFLPFEVIRGVAAEGLANYSGSSTSSSLQQEKAKTPPELLSDN